MGKYSGFSFIYMLICYIRTKMFYRHARLIRFPIDIRNAKYFKYGTGFTTGKNCRIECIENGRDHPLLYVGNNLQLNDNVHLVCSKSITIGNDVLIASKVFISDTSHGIYSGDQQSSPYEKPSERKLVSDSVKIGDNVWIGENVVIFPGTQIGAGSIIGASSIVKCDIPPNSIAVGIPATVIKKYDDSNKKWEPQNKRNV